MMFKLVAVLCGTIFVTLLVIGGRDDGPVRYGLVPGRMASLVYVDPDAGTAPVVAAAEPVATPRVALRPVVAGQNGVVEAAFVDPDAVPQSGLTLALPLVTASRPAPEEAIAPVPAPVAAAAEPLVQYVVGSSVNVRLGPSADTEALTRLPRGEAVLVLPSDTPGWSMIRIEGDGVEGYIATRFLGDRPQDGLFSATD